MYKGSSRFLQHRVDRAAESGIEQKKGPGIPRKFKSALKSSELIQGYIDEEVKGGYEISFDGFIAFCPHSEMYPRPLSRLDLIKLKRESLEFRVIEVSLRSVVVSRKKAAQLRTWENIKEAFSKGTPLSGTVKDIQPYGAFVDLGGIDGLLHISEVKEGRIDNICTVLKRGQALKVFVLSVDENSHRVSLSLRRTTLQRPE